MDFDEALKRAKDDYYGESETKQSTNKREKQIMTREQLKKKSKKQLNVLLTPRTGGYTPDALEKVTQAAMIKALLAYEKEAETKKKAAKKASGKGKVGVIDTIVTIMEAGKCTKEQIVAKLSKKFPDRDTVKMSHTVSAFIYKYKTKHDIRKEKDKKVTKYWIQTRKSKQLLK